MIKITADVRPAKAKKSLIKQGEEFWLERNKNWIAVVADRDQESSKSKKIFVREQHPEGSGELSWVFISQLITDDSYQALINGETEIAADEAPIEFVPPYVAGDWLHFEAKPGDIRLVECSITPLYDGGLVWVIDWKGINRDEFLARPECLSKVTENTQLIWAANNKEAVEAKRLEHQLAEAARNKAERDAIEARIAAESADEAAETREAAKVAKAEAATPEASPAPEVATVARSLFKCGQNVYWLSPDGDYRRANVQADQTPNSDKISIISWKRGTRTGSDPHFVPVSEILTGIEYTNLLEAMSSAQDTEAATPETSPAPEASEATAAQVLTPEASPAPEAPARYKQGDWVLWTAWPGDIKPAECSADQGEYTQQVQLTRWEAGRRYEFSATADKLEPMESPEEIAGAIANKEAVEAMINAPNAPAQAPYTLPNRVSADTPKAIKKGDRLWWQQAPGRYRFAVVQEDQAGPEASKVYVLHWAENGNKPKGPVWAEICDLITEAEYKKYKQSLAKKQPETVAKQQAEETPATEVKTLFTSPAEFAELMKQKQTPEEIKALCDRLLALPRFQVSAKTIMQRLCDYNKAIKAAGIALVDGVNALTVNNQDGSSQLRHLYFKYVGIIDHNWDAARKIAADKVVKKLDHCVEVDADQYLETIKYCLVSDNIYKVFAGLVAASGRRPVEIAYYSDFSYHGVDYGGEYHLLFDKQAKKRDQQMDKYGITTIGCTAETFLKYLDIVRNDPKIKGKIDKVDKSDLDALKQISDPIRVQVNREIAKAFCWLPARADESSQTCKTLRSIWAAMVTTLHNKLTTNPLLSASRLLGHFEGDPASLLTTLGYSDIIIKTTPDSFPKPAKNHAADAQLVADEGEDEDEDGDALEAETAQAEEAITVDAVEAEDDQALEAATVEAEDAIEDTEDGEIEQERAELMEGPGVDDKVIATAIAMPIPYTQVVAESAGERHPHDFYETPPWMVLAMLEHAGVSGTVGECCNGNGAISEIFEMAGFDTWTSDIDPQKPADYHGDAADPKFWDSLPDTDWIITNPPYKKLSAPILINAYNKAKKGIVFILKMNWWELCQDRVDFLKQHPPTAFINLPRYCYRKGTATDKWATDEGPTVGYVWDKSKTHGLTQLVCLPVDDLRLFHRNPDGIPALEKIQAEVKDIMQKRAVKVETVAPSPAAKTKAKSAKKEAPIAAVPPEGFASVEPKNIARITEKMQPFLAHNAALDPSVRWYVGQTIVKAITGCNNTTAHAWINFYKEYLEGVNKGLNSSSTNRGRVFNW